MKKRWMLSMVSSCILLTGCYHVHSSKKQETTQTQSVVQNQVIGKLGIGNATLYALPQQTKEGTTHTLKQQFEHIQAIYQVRPVQKVAHQALETRVQTVQIARKERRYTVLFFLTNTGNKPLKTINLRVQLALPGVASFGTVAAENVQFSTSQMGPLPANGVLLLSFSGSLSEAQIQQAETQTVQAFQLVVGS